MSVVLARVDHGVDDDGPMNKCFHYGQDFRDFKTTICGREGGAQTGRQSGKDASHALYSPLSVVGASCFVGCSPDSGQLKGGGGGGGGGGGCWWWWWGGGGGGGAGESAGAGFPRGAWRNVCPARARRATFVLSILSLAPGLSSPWEVPQVDCTRLQTFLARHLA